MKRCDCSIGVVLINSCGPYGLLVAFFSSPPRSKNTSTLAACELFEHVSLLFSYAFQQNWDLMAELGLAPLLSVLI